MIRRQAGFSVLDFVLAMGVVSAILALGATFGMNTLRQGEQQTAFKIAMTDVWQATERAIIDEWRLSGCRSLTAPPSLSSLVQNYDAPAYLLTLPYAITIDYRTAPSVTVSGGVTLTVTLPEGMSGFSLKPVLTPLAESIHVTERTVVLYHNIASIQSPLQHQYFDAETGVCRRIILETSNEKNQAARPCSAGCAVCDGAVGADYRRCGQPNEGKERN